MRHINKILESLFPDVEIITEEEADRIIENARAESIREWQLENKPQKENRNVS